MGTAKQKDIRISLIRMISTMMVVLLHITQQMEKFVLNLNIITDWLNLGLVMFFCISAFLYSKREIKNVFKWYGHRYAEIAIPAIITSVITIVAFALIGKGNIPRRNIFAAIMSGMGFEAFLSDSWMFIQLWFLTYLLFFYFTFPLAQKANCKSGSEVGFWVKFILIAMFAQIAVITIEWVFKIELLSVGILLRFYLPYFTLRRYDINDFKLERIMKFFLIIAVIMIGVTACFRYVLSIPSISAITELMFIYTQTLSGFVLFYCLYRAFEKIKTYSTVLRLSDTYSYNIYLTHCLFIGYSTSVIFLFSSKVIGIILALILTAVASILLRYLTYGVKKLLP